MLTNIKVREINTGRIVEVGSNPQAIYQPARWSAFLGDALKPCPCCGGEAKLRFFGTNKSQLQKVAISCRKCSLKLKNTSLRRDFELVAKTAITRWNTRV